MTWTLPILLVAAEEVDAPSFCTDSPLLRLPIGRPEPSAAGACSRRAWGPTPRVTGTIAIKKTASAAGASTSPC